MKIREDFFNVIYFYISLVKIKIDIICFVIIILLKLLYFQYLTGIESNGLGILMSFSGILLITSTVNAFDNYLRKLFLFIINTLISVIIISDLIYWNYFNDYISVFITSQIDQVWDVRFSILEIISIKYLAFIADFPLWLYLLKTKSIHYMCNKNNRYQKFNIFLSIIMIIIASPLFYVFSIYMNSPYSLRGCNQDLVKLVGILNYHIFDGYDYYKKIFFGKPAKLTDEEFNEIEEWFSKRNSNNILENNYFGVAQGKNLIVIQEESLQEFVIDLRIDGQEITPNLNRLVQESTYFKNCYDQTGQGHTSDAEFLSLISYYPTKTGSAYFQYSSNEYQSLVQILEENNYYTMAAHAFKENFWNRKNMYNNLGFDKFMSENDFSAGEHIGWGLADSEFFEQVLMRMKNFPQPYFTFLVTLSNHEPYNSIPQKYKTLNLGEIEGTMLGNYLHSIHYCDMSLGLFMERLKDCNLYEQSVIVIYGDHTAGLLDNEISELLLVKNEFDRVETKKIPFIIHIPNGEMKGIRNDVCGLVDFSPTLLHLLGVNVDCSLFMGKNLFSNYDNSVVVFRNGSFSNGSILFVTNNQTYESGNFYNIESGQLINKSDYRKEFYEAQKRLTISDTIIENNLIPVLCK